MNRFSSEWQHLHHPSMDVSGDVTFYHNLYDRLLGLEAQKARYHNEPAILSLLLYTENIIAVGLDGVYEYMYRRLDDMTGRLCEEAGIVPDAVNQVCRLISNAVADAPRSALRQWITECVLSGDFPRLSDMLVYFAREDRVLRLAYPDLRYRKDLFLRLTGDLHAAQRMLWTDMAFNWNDKYGNSISDALARQCGMPGYSTDEREHALMCETAESLRSIHSERLDSYTVIERKDERTMTLRHRDGHVLRDVRFPASTPVPESVRHTSIVAQLVTWSGRTFVNGPAQWIAGERKADWNGDKTWSGITEKEKDAAKRTFFTTPSGKRISLYEDLYTIPEDSSACYANQGIYTDEPNIFDFLEWLNPADSVGKAEARHA